MKAPRCDWCGAPLAKYTSAIFFSAVKGPLPQTVEEAQARDGTSQEVTKVVRHREGIVRLNLWDGESYGYHGNGKFCSLRCGYMRGMKPR